MYKTIKKLLFICFMYFTIFGCFSFDRGRCDDCYILNEVVKNDKNTPVVLRRLHREGEDVDKSNSEGIAPIHMAATLDAHLVNVLLDLGANINIVDDNGNTPLHYATGNCNILTMKALLLRGADKKIKNKLGQLAIDYVYDDRCSGQKEQLLKTFKQKY